MLKNQPLIRINNIFDYIYYRLNKFYYKWDGENGTTSAIGISMFQSMLIGNVITLLLKIILTMEQLKTNSRTLIFFIIIIFITLVIYNYFFRYKNKYLVIKERWKDETNKDKIQRGILVILALVSPWVFIIILAIM